LHETPPRKRSHRGTSRKSQARLILAPAGFDSFELQDFLSNQQRFGECSEIIIAQKVNSCDFDGSILPVIAVSGRIAG
jgi:hypothetical protein